MRKRKKRIIVYSIICLIFITSIFLYKYYISKNNKKLNLTEDNENNLQNFDEIIKNENSELCTVNGQKVTTLDVKLTEIMNDENENSAKEKTIEQKVIIEELKKENIILNDKEKIYIEEIVKGLKNDIVNANEYTEDEKEKFLEAISEKLNNDALIEQYKAEFIKKLANKTFSSEDENIMKLYRICLNLQEKWENKKNISYVDLINARENVYKAYINKLVSESIIKNKI